MNFEIFDFHCHPFADGIENICQYPEGPASASDFAMCMDRAGVGRFAGSVIGGKRGEHTFEDVHACNMTALRLRDFYDGRYIPGIHIHPSYVKESIAEMEAMKKEGVKLIGELVPYIQGWGAAYSSPEAVEIFRAAGELGMIVSAHCGAHDDMDAVCEKCPNTTFVFAHPGEKETYLRHLERMEKYENAYLDLSGTGLFRYAMLAHGVNRVGAERFLFGTDFPVCSASMQVSAILGEFLTEDDYNAIFFGNAKRLLDLE